MVTKRRPIATIHALVTLPVASRLRALPSVSFGMLRNISVGYECDILRVIISHISEKDLF